MNRGMAEMPEYLFEDERPSREVIRGRGRGNLRGGRGGKGGFGADMEEMRSRSGSFERDSIIQSDYESERINFRGGRGMRGFRG